MLTCWVKRLYRTARNN